MREPSYPSGQGFWHRARKGVIIGIAATVAFALITAGAILLVSGISRRLSDRPRPVQAKDLNGEPITMDPADGQTPIRPVKPPRDGLLADERQGGAAARGDGDLYGFSIPAIGLNHFPVKTMASTPDGTIDPPDCEAMWADTSRRTSPGYYKGGHGRMIVAAHSSNEPGVCAGNLLEGASAPGQTVTRWPAAGDEVDVGQARFRITRIVLEDRYRINENRDVHNARGLIVFTCYRGVDTTLGDWRRQGFPRYTHIILADPIGGPAPNESSRES